VTWGSSFYGGDSSTAATLLMGIQSISATGSAFAAIKADGSVVTWGSYYSGGYVRDTAGLEPGGETLTLK
jgi:hypothetical protein